MPHPTSHACDTEVPSLQLLLLVIYQICEIKFEFDKSFRVKYVLGLNWRCMITRFNEDIGRHINNDVEILLY